MLNELILKNSDSLEKLNLQHLKELFSGDPEDDDYGDMDDLDPEEAEELKRAIEENKLREAQQR